MECRIHLGERLLSLPLFGAGLIQLCLDRLFLCLILFRGDLLTEGVHLAAQPLDHAGELIALHHPPRLPFQERHEFDFGQGAMGRIAALDGGGSGLRGHARPRRREGLARGAP